MIEINARVKYKSRGLFGEGVIVGFNDQTGEIKVSDIETGLCRFFEPDEIKEMEK